MSAHRLASGAIALVISMLLCSTARTEFVAVAGWEQQLFPSYIIATASLKESEHSDEHHLGDPRGLIGVEVTSPCSGAKVKVTAENTGFFEPSVFSGELSEAGAVYRIFPKLKYHYDRLAECDQATATSVTLRVQIDDQDPEEKSVTLTMRSINDCPFLISSGQEFVDTSFAFAAYVNEQHPFVDKLLREALDIGMVKRFNGYQERDVKKVLLQVYAVWDLLVARDVRYSDITTTAAKTDMVVSQHVRLIEESVNNSQANCVDGSVLLVSILRKIGIDAFLVIEPGHCYVGFRGDEKGELTFGIETTLIGEDVNLEELEVSDALDESISEDVRNDESFASFAAALQLATGKIVQDSEKFDDPDAGFYRIIDIADARKQGVLPIAFKKRESFTTFNHDLRASKDSAAEETTEETIETESETDEESESESDEDEDEESETDEDDEDTE